MTSRDEHIAILQNDCAWLRERSAKLEAEKAELVKALEFYADAKNWDDDGGIQSVGTIAIADRGGGIDGYHIYGGKLARETLQRLKGG